MNHSKEFPPNIPDLLDSQRIDDVSQRLMVALDAQAMEKKLFDQMVAQCLKVLQPEIERLTYRIVSRHAEDLLRSRTPGHLDSFVQPDDSSPARS